MARILFCCINGNGLGHVTRLLALIRQVRKLEPKHQILVLTSSEFPNVLAKENIASVKVPSPEIHRKNKGLPVAYLSQSISSQVVATFRPEAVVIDTTPSGLCGEYMSFINIIPKRIFIFGMFPNFIATPQYTSSLKLFGRILMPYSEDEKGYLKITSDDRSEWVGHFIVRSRDEILSREQARNRLRINLDERVVYVGLGGGGNPENNNVLMWVLETLSGFSNLKIACPIQPLAPDSSLIFNNAQCIPITHYPMIEYFNAFDFAITSGGMNTIAEITHAALPSLWIPLGHPSTDQEFNTKLFSKQGFGLPVKAFDTDSLKSAINVLQDSRQYKKMKGLMEKWGGGSGAVRAAKSVIQYINS